jgi:hypothetical protein
MSDEERVLPRAAVSIERTVNLGNYENVKVFMSIADLTAETTDEEIEEVIETQERAYGVLRERIKERTNELKALARESTTGRRNSA